MASQASGGNFLDGAIDGALGGAIHSGFSYAANMQLRDAIGSDDDGPDCTLDKTCMDPDKIPEHLGEERYDLNDMFEGGSVESSAYGWRTLYGKPDYHSAIDVVPKNESLDKFGTEVRSIFDGITTDHQRSNGTHGGMVTMFKYNQ